MHRYQNASGKIKVLLLGGDPDNVEPLKEILLRNNFDITQVNSLEEAMTSSSKEYFPIIVCDIELHRRDWLASLSNSKQLQPPLVILVTSHATLETTVAALSEGAFDYICRSEDPNRLEADILHSIDRAIKHLVAVESHSTVISQTLEKSASSFIGNSPPMTRLYRMIAKTALSRGNVVIVGESGTGKELVARAIHSHSDRASKPFVTLNCGALTESLLESELFGHLKGSFTGANSNKKGLFEEAEGGTFFLDEIGEISQSMQVKLLRTLQEGEIRPVGATENRKVDVRIIAATHRDLLQRMEDGLFREDLYYRLNVFNVEVPPLRDRREDIPELVRHFIDRGQSKDPKTIQAISEDAMTFLLTHSWPGNIRELENAVNRALGMATGNILLLEDFPEENNHPSRSTSPSPDGMTEPRNHREKEKSLDEVQAEHILHVLQVEHFNKTRVASILGIDRRTLYRKAKHYQISLSRKSID